jgi:hypothetical protein
LPQQTSVIERILLRLAGWQLRSPWKVLLIGLVLTIIGAELARGLELRTGSTSSSRTTSHRCSSSSD